MNEQLSDTTKAQIDQLAEDVETIPDLGLIGLSVLKSRHYNSILPFEWVDRLNNIVDEGDSLRRHVVNYFLDQVEQNEGTDFESAILPALVEETVASFYSGAFNPPDDSDGRVVVVDGDIHQVEQLEADDRGRITLGSDYANETIPVAVLEAQEGE